MAERTDDGRRATFLAELESYAEEYPADIVRVDHFKRFVGNEPRCFDREFPEAHLTGSAWIISRDRSAVLMTHHHKIGAWIQLGGHVEGGETLVETALREAREESGIDDVALVENRRAAPFFDLDVLLVPENPKQARHLHYDVRFLLEADRAAPLCITSESKGLDWVELGDIARYTQEATVRRLARKASLLLKT